MIRLGSDKKESKRDEKDKKYELKDLIVLLSIIVNIGNIDNRFIYIPVALHQCLGEKDILKTIRIHHEKKKIAAKMKKCFCFSETQANLIFFKNSKPRLQEGRVSVLDIMWDSVAVRALRVMWRCLELVELQNPIFHCCNTRNMEIPEKLFLLINRAREIKRGEPCGQNSRWGLPQKNILKTNCSYQSKEKASLQSFGKHQISSAMVSAPKACHAVAFIRKWKFSQKL